MTYQFRIADQASRRDASTRGVAEPVAPGPDAGPLPASLWAGLDDRTAGEFVRHGLVSLPMLGTPALRLGRHELRAVELGKGLYFHEIRTAR